VLQGSAQRRLAASVVWQGFLPRYGGAT